MNNGYREGQSVAAPTYIGKSTGVSQSASSSGTWTCFKCRQVNTGTEKSCSGCANLPQGRAPGAQVEETKEVWVCSNEKCRYESNVLEACSKCQWPKSAVISSQVNYQGFEEGSSHQGKLDPQVAANSAESVLSATRTVEIRVTVVLSQGGWKCEGCGSLNELYYTFCSQCRELNSIGKALLDVGINYK